MNTKMVVLVVADVIANDGFTEVTWLCLFLYSFTWCAKKTRPPLKQSTGG